MTSLHLPLNRRKTILEMNLLQALYISSFKSIFQFIYTTSVNEQFAHYYCLYQYLNVSLEIASLFFRECGSVSMGKISYFNWDVINLSAFRKKKKWHIFVLSPLTTWLPHSHLFSSIMKILNTVNFYFYLYLLTDSLPTVTSIILPNSVSTLTMSLLVFLLFPTVVLQLLHHLWFPCSSTSENNQVIHPDYHSPPRQYQPLERSEAKGKKIDNDRIDKWQLKRNIVTNK